MAHQLSTGDVTKLGVPVKPWKRFDLEPEAGRAWLRYQSALRLLGNATDCVCRWVSVDGSKRLRVQIDPQGVDLFRQCAEADPQADIDTKAAILSKIGGRQ